MSEQSRYSTTSRTCTSTWRPARTSRRPAFGPWTIDSPYEVEISAELERFTEQVTRQVARLSDDDEN